MKRKGFTLIELLAVIVILAIIALISTPIIISVLERARKGAFEDSAYGVISALKLYYADASLDGWVTEETFTFPDDTKLKISGERPKSGSATLDAEGKIEIAISNGEWCAVKTKDEEKVTIKDYSVGECTVENVETPSTPETCFTVNETGEMITDYICENKDVAIPSMINGVTITTIGANAFRENNLISVVIPESVTTIGKFAFLGNKLTSITIPNGVKSIGGQAFVSNQLTTLIISSSVTSIGYEAFAINSLTSVTIPNSVTSIEYGAFNNNQLPESQAFIFERNINGTENKSKVVSYGGVKRAGVVIPSTVETIGTYAFASNALTSVTIPNSVTSIESQAFSRDKLVSITIPSSVATIGSDAFAYNQSTMKVIVNKPENSITGSPWGATSVEWNG